MYVDCCVTLAEAILPVGTTQVIVRSQSHVLTPHERWTWRAIHFNDFYDCGDERATVLQKFANRVPSDAVSRSRKMDSSSTIRLGAAPTCSPSRDLQHSHHLHKVAGICNQFPPRPNTKNVCTITPLTLPAFIFTVPPT